MDNKELVTIVVPAYNEETRLNKCLDSLVNQTYENIEVIVVDDGSTDNTLEIANSYKNKDGRFIVIHKENGGLSSARNVALNIYKGKYIYFLDSDDYLYPTSIEYLLNVITSYDVDIVYSFTNRKNENPMILDSDIEVKNKDEAILSYLRGENFSEPVCAKLFKRYIFDDLRFEEGRIHEDTFITYQILDRINSIAITKFNGYISAIRPDSITHSTFSDKNYDKVIAGRNIFNFYSNTKYRDLAYSKYVGNILHFILKTNKLENVKLNPVARSELKHVIKENGLKGLKIKFYPLIVLSKLNLIKYFSI